MASDMHMYPEDDIRNLNEENFRLRQRIEELEANADDMRDALVIARRALRSAREATRSLPNQIDEALEATKRFVPPPPQFKAGEHIDITGGMDSAEYVRRMRGDDEDQ